MMRKRLMSAVMCASMITGLMCGSVVVKAEDNTDDILKDVSGKITVWVYGDYENRLVDEFNKMYPDVEVEFLVVDGTEAPKKLQTIISSGDYSELPDVVSLEVASRGQLINLDIWEVLDQEPYNVNQDDLLDMIIPKVTNDKGELICLPIDNCIGDVYYKRDFAEKYLGTSDPDELAEKLQTWDDYMKVAEELSGKMDEGEYMIAGATDFILPMMNQVVDSSVQDGKFAVGDQYKDILAFANKAQKTGVVGQMEWQSATYWASPEINNVLFYPSAAWFIPDVIKQGSDEQMGNWGVIPAPSGGYNSGGSAYAIPSSSENKEAAFAWAHFLSLTMEGSEAWRDINGVLNCNKEAFETEGFYDGDNGKIDWFDGQDALSVLRESSLNTPAAMPLTAYDYAIRSALVQASVKIMNEDMTDDEIYQNFLDNLYSTVPELK